MPTYIQKAEISDIAVVGSAANGNRLLSSEIDPSTTIISIVVPAGGPIQNLHFITRQGQINSDAWESGGNMTVALRVSLTAVNVRARVRIRRLDVNGNTIQQGTITAFQTLIANTTHTFTAAVPTWTTAQESCGNRLAIFISFDEVLGGGGAACDIEVGNINCEVVSTITENNGNCRIINVT